MNRRLFTLVALFSLTLGGGVAMADEGMWLPSLIAERIGDMQSKGFRLDAEDIYSVNRASLKDAVLLFGSGCTAEASTTISRTDSGRCPGPRNCPIQD